MRKELEGRREHKQRESERYAEGGKKSTMTTQRAAGDRGGEK